MRLIFSVTISCLFLALAGGASLATAQPMDGGYPMEGGALAHPPMYYERALVNPPEGSDLAHANTFAGDALENMMRGRVNKTAGILAATMVNLDNLDESSSFGRLVMQQIGSRLSQYGYRVMDVRLRADMELDELLRIAEEEASCEVFGLLKRADEKWVTERAYDNPKFVEDLVRDIALRLGAEPRVAAWSVASENFESIHNHSAYAFIEGENLAQ